LDPFDAMRPRRRGRLAAALALAPAALPALPVALAWTAWPRRALPSLLGCLAGLPRPEVEVFALAPPPEEGSCITCLGVMDDLLARCRGGVSGSLSGCVASQDDRPEVFEPPWQLPEPRGGEQVDIQPLASKLRRAVMEAGGNILSESDDHRYLRAEFVVDVPLLGQDADDVEWYFTPDDLIVQFRAERRSGAADFGLNRRRLEEIRQALGWDLVPVVRNRQRALFFGESPFDNFGPALYDALRPGQEPTPGEAQGLMNLFARDDDLGAENAVPGLDEATRSYLRKKCDGKSQICE
ncbi:Hypothetical protein SCF082_LOCUS34868, partial [Durusdinium trenchii]